MFMLDLYTCKQYWRVHTYIDTYIYIYIYNKHIYNYVTKNPIQIGVFILAATNAPWSIDESLLRAGRLEDVCYVALPNEKTRENILINYSNKFNCDVNSIDYNQLAILTKGYSGADLRNVFRRAGLNAFKRYLNASSSVPHTHIYIYIYTYIYIPPSDPLLLLLVLLILVLNTLIASNSINNCDINFFSWSLAVSLLPNIAWICLLIFFVYIQTNVLYIYIY